MYCSHNKVAMHNAIDDSGVCSQPRGVKPWMHISEELRNHALRVSCFAMHILVQRWDNQARNNHSPTISLTCHTLDLPARATTSRTTLFSPSYTSQHGHPSPHISIPCNHPMTAQSHSQSPVRTAFPDTRVDASFTRRVACVCATLGRFLGCVPWLVVAEVELCGLDQVDGYGQEDWGLGGGCGT